MKAAKRSGNSPLSILFADLPQGSPPGEAHNVFVCCKRIHINGFYLSYESDLRVHKMPALEELELPIDNWLYTVEFLNFLVFGSPLLHSLKLTIGLTRCIKLVPPFLKRIGTLALSQRVSYETELDMFKLLMQLESLT